MLSCILRFMCISSHPCILISSGSCVPACIFTSSHPHTFGFMCACWHPRILTPYILRFMRACLHPCILTSSYTQVPVYLVVSSHPHILRSYSQVCACLLVPSHPHILMPSRSHVLIGILASSYPQIHVCFLLSFHPLILIYSDSCVLAWILASSYSQALRLMWSCMLIDIVASLHHYSLVS